MISVMLPLNSLFMHVTKTILFFLRQNRHADYSHRNMLVGYQIWDRNCYDYKAKTIVLIERTRDNTYVFFLFHNVFFLFFLFIINIVQNTNMHMFIYNIM